MPHIVSPRSFSDYKVQDGVIWVRDGEAWQTADPAQCADYAAKLRNALREVRLRTEMYREQHDEWPLVAGVFSVVNAALGGDFQ